MLKVINHITINVVDLEKTLDFYGRVLKLPKLEEVDRGDHYIRYYGLPGGTKLELIAYNYQTDSAAYVPVSSGIIRHFALEVESISKCSEVLKENNVKITEGPIRCEELGVYYMLVQDPNGVELEFVERL